MADKGGTGNDTNSGKLQNPFAKDREGFISFSSSTPQLTSSGGGGARNRDKFVPRRGKANRMSNWKNFGDSVADEDRNQFSNARPSEVSSPYRGGHSYTPTPPEAFYSPRGRGQGRGFQGGYQNIGSPAFRGGPFHGGHQPRHHHQQQSPHWNRGRGGGFTPRGHGQNFRGGNRSYFHPSMLENPWSQLMATRKLTTTKSLDDSRSGFSDSLVVQVGTSLLDNSLINPAPDVFDDSRSIPDGDDLVSEAEDDE